MKKLLSISLLIVIAIATIFPFAYLKMERKAIKKSIKHKIIAGIDREELVLLVFDKDKIDQLVIWKHSKEFQYKGEMYDIVEEQSIDNKIHYWVWWDKEETALNKKLANLVRQNFSQNPYQNNKDLVINHFIKTLYFSAKHPLQLTRFKKTINHYPFYQSLISNWKHLPTTPPPRYR